MTEPFLAFSHRLIDVMTLAAALIGLSLVLWRSRSAGKPLTTGAARRSDRDRLKEG